MNKGISYLTIGGFTGDKPCLQTFREAKKMGYDAVELAFGVGELHEEVTEAECLDIRKQAKAQGIGLVTLASGTFWTQSLTAPDPKTRKAAVEFGKKYIQTAKRLGAKAVLLVPGAVDVGWDPSQPVVPYADVWKRSQSGIRKLIPLAEKLKVTIGVENVWNKFLLGPMEMKMFIDSFESRYVGVYFDVGNVLITGYPEHWIEILGKRIKAVHFKNFSRQDCGGVLHGFGDDLLVGDVNWPGVMAALGKIKYNGPVTAEMIPFSRLPNLVLPDVKLARKTSKAMDKILSMK